MTDEELIARLRSQIGDDVQHVYDHEALFRTAADRITALLARAEAAEAALAAERETEARLTEALKPFARCADEYGRFDRDEYETGLFDLTVGQFRRARAALTQKDRTDG